MLEIKSCEINPMRREAMRKSQKAYNNNLFFILNEKLYLTKLNTNDVCFSTYSV